MSTRRGGWRAGSGRRGLVWARAAVTLAALVPATALEAAQLDRRAEVSVRSANVRQDCSLSSPVLRSLPRGEQLVVLESVGEWHRVRHAYSGLEGCMHDSVITVLPTTAAPEPYSEPAPEPVRDEPSSVVAPAPVETSAPAWPLRDRRVGDLRVWYVNETLDPDDGDSIDENGFGGRAQIFLPLGIFLTGQYQEVDFGDDFIEFDVEDTRMGAGWGWTLGGGAGMLFGKAEYVSLGSDFDADGFGVTVGGETSPARWVFVRGGLGYLIIEDADGNEIDGLEASLGADFIFVAGFGAFVEARQWFASDEGFGDIDFRDLRAGLVYHF